MEISESSSSVDDSLESIDGDDYKMDLGTLLEGYTEGRSPAKKKPKRSYSPIPDNIFSDTPKLTLRDDSITNDLFQVTRSRSQPNLATSTSTHHKDLFFGENDTIHDPFTEKRLNNSKIEKLVQVLGGELQGSDFELDDQVRSRIFKGRYRDHHDGEVDDQLGNYLDDKENHPFPDPLKTVRNKANNSIKKSGKTYFGSSPAAVAGGKKLAPKSLIPTLRPLSNLSTNTPNSSTNATAKTKTQKYIESGKPDAKKYISEYLRSSSAPAEAQRSPKRVCTPRHLHVPSKSLRPSLKSSHASQNIYIVDSSTGLVNDATQFGTELNASNCEGFPLPEDVNEIVQIPTNDDSSTDRQKMAIIKAYQSKQTKTRDASLSPTPRTGFYTKEEFQIYNGEATESQEPKHIKRAKSESKRGVQWADQLEW
ncbi:Something about silencing protein 4 domain-containing protein [[Candida] zeylanoides]